MEGLSAAMFVAGHTCSSGCFTLSALVLTDVTCLHTNRASEENTCMYVVFCDMSKCTDEFGYLVVAVVGHRLENYGLHS